MYADYHTRSNKQKQQVTQTAYSVRHLQYQSVELHLPCTAGIIITSVKTLTITMNLVVNILWQGITRQPCQCDI